MASSVEPVVVEPQKPEPTEQTEPTPAAAEAKEVEPPPPPPPSSGAEAEKSEVLESEAPPPETKGLLGDAAAAADYFPVANVVLRFLLFASAVVAVAVMGSSKQSKLVAIPFPPFLAPLTAKFTDSSAFIYFVAALSVTGLYAIITTLLSIYALWKPTSSTKLLAHFVIFDVLLLGAVAAATGSAGAVAYVGLKGYSKAGWMKSCDTYGSFCRHIAGSVAVSLFGSLLLVFLIILSLRSISKKIPK